MTWGWLSNIKNIAEIVKSLGELIKKNNATRDLLLRELKLNIMAFERAQKENLIDYDKLLSLLKNDMIKKARESGYRFQKIKPDVIVRKHIKDNRNLRYIGRDCEWLFKSIDEKIEDLRNQKEYFGSLQRKGNFNISLQFSNLFYKLKLLADFIQE